MYSQVPDANTRNTPYGDNNVPTSAYQAHTQDAVPTAGVQANMIGQLQQWLYGDPALAQGQYGFDNAMRSIFQNQGMYDYQAGNLQQNAGFQQQELGLQRQGLGIQQGALNREAPYLNAQWGLQQQQYGLQNQGFDQAQLEAWQGADRQTRGLNSAETSRGAFGSVGHNQGLGDISTQLQNSLSTIGRQRQSASLSEQGADLSHQEQLAKIGDAQKQLDLSSQRLGLSGQEITARLNQSLNQLGLSTVLDSTTLLSEIGKMQNGENSPLSQMIGEIYPFLGLNLFGDTTNG